MSFLKNVIASFKDQRVVKEPIIYKEFNEKSSLLTTLTELAESSDPNIDLKKVNNHLKLFSIGNTGEKNVLFELQHSMVPMLILHDVYLEYEDYKAQLDFVVVTRKFILVIEVKKLFGNIHITDKGEFQRVLTKNNKVLNREGMYSPINQVERQSAILEKLLKDKGVIKKCPVKYAVTFANPKTILEISKDAPENIQSRVIRHDQIKAFLKKELHANSPVEMLDHFLYEIADGIIENCKEKPFNIEEYTLDKTNKTQSNTTSTPSNKNDLLYNYNDASDNLRKSLMDFRLQRSKELNIKPYYIFTNKELDSLVEQKPLSLLQLLKVEGMGEKKVAEFGEEIITIIKSTLSYENLIPNLSILDSSVKESIEQTKSLNPTKEILRTTLTTFRTTRSKELNVKPYYIFTNKILESILENTPTTMLELLNIDGIGQKKAEEFGEEILRIIKQSNENMRLSDF